MVYCPYMHTFSPLYGPLGDASLFVPLVLVAVLWTVVLKGFALWFSARASQKWWFIALLVVNTLGILEIIYLIWFRPKPNEPAATAPVEPSSPAQ